MKKIKEFLHLSLEIAKAQFKLRNEGSYLGVLWYLLNPILMFLLLLFLFSQRLGGDIPYYPLYLLLGIIMYNFFQQVTSFSLGSMKDNREIMKSINFSREASTNWFISLMLFRLKPLVRPRFSFID